MYARVIENLTNFAPVVIGVGLALLAVLVVFDAWEGALLCLALAAVAFTLMSVYDARRHAKMDESDLTLVIGSYMVFTLFVGMLVTGSISLIFTAYLGRAGLAVICLAIVGGAAPFTISTEALRSLAADERPRLPRVAAGLALCGIVDSFLAFWPDVAP